MKVNVWVVVGLVLLGIGVGAMSLYSASVTGVMNKMGLVGGDFTQSIDQNELARQLLSESRDFECRTPQVVRKIPGYLFSRGEERVELSGELGGERIICGVLHVKEENVERGVYTIVKGLYYLNTHYTELRELVSPDRSQCRLLADPYYERWVESYLVSTQGKINEIVLEVYKQVEDSRSRVEELCVD